MALGQNKGFNLRTAQTQAGTGVDIDAGLRAYMLGVYNYMCVGLALTGAVAFAVSTSEPLLQAIYGTPLKWVVMFAPLAFVFIFSARLHAMSASAAQTCFWAFACLMGLSLAYIFVAFTGESIARTFFVTAGAFAGLSLYGYTTKRDLAPMGAFLIMGVIGILLASIVNIFLASSGLHFVITVLGVLLFSALTAFDTQQIKATYFEGDSAELARKKSVSGALRLYLDFINLFMFLLQFLGNRE